MRWVHLRVKKPTDFLRLHIPQLKRDGDVKQDDNTPFL